MGIGNDTSVQKTRNSTIDEALIIIFLFSLFFEKLLSNNMYIVTGVTIIIYAFTKVIMRKKIVLSYGFRWQVMFAFFSSLTLFQSVLFYDILATSHLYVLLTSFFILISITFIFDSSRDIEKLVKKYLLYFAVCGTLFAIFIVLTEWDSLGIGRLGSHSLGDKFGTATALSFYTITTTCVLIWFSFVKKKNRYIYIAATMLLMYLNFMTGGRKAVLLPVIFLVVFINIHYKHRIRYRIKWLAYTVGILFFIYYISLNFQIIYDVFGYRLVDTIDGLLGRDISGSETIISNTQREMMIRYGLISWMKSPLIGNGFGLFQELVKEYGLYRTYAHNNYVDLLVSGGVVLIVAYYWIHVKLITLMLVIRKKSIDDLLDFFISMTAVILVSDFFTTSYYLIIWNTFIVIGGSYVFRAYPRRTFEKTRK